MIVDRILDYLGGSGREIPDAVLAVAHEQFDRTFRRNLGKQRAPGERRRISASLPWYCPRRAYYTLTGAAGEVPSGRSRVAFLLGDLIETAVVTLARQAGIVFPWPNERGEQLELRWTFPTPNGPEEVVGHTDLAIETSADGLIVGDVKSMADYTFREFARACSDPSAPWHEVERWGYVAQLRFYMWLLELTKQGTGERGFFVGVNKNTGHLAELWVERCPETVAMFERAIPYLVHVRETYDRAADAVRETAIANGSDLDEAEAAASIVPRNEAHGLPPRPAWSKIVRLGGANKRSDGSKGPVLEVCTDKDQTQGQGWRCGYCPHTAACFPGFSLVPMSRGPKWRKAAD